MALNDGTGAPDPLERAIEAARSEPVEAPGGWAVLADEVMRKARAITRPDQTVLAAVADDGGRTLVSTRVLLTAVRVALGPTDSHAPDDVSFRVEGDALVGVDIDLVAAYGTDLVALAADVRERVRGAVADLVPLAPAGSDGPVTDAEGRPVTALTVDVAVVDVVEGDPRRV